MLPTPRAPALKLTLWLAALLAAAAVADPYVWPGKVACNLRLMSCPDGRDLGLPRDRVAVLARACARTTGC